MVISEKKNKKKAHELGIKMVILFGSRASGKTRSDSDYDIAVLTTKEKNIGELDNYNNVLFFLCNALHIPDYKIDLTNLNNASPLLAYEVLFSGRMVYGERDYLDELRARTFRYFGDAKPLFEFEERMSQKKHEIIGQAIKEYA